MEVGTAKKVYHVNLLRKWHSKPEEHTYSHELTNEEDDDITERGNSTQEVTMGKQLTLTQQRQLQAILDDFPTVMTKEPGKTDVISHSIPTVQCQPLRQRPYRIPYAYKEDILNELNQMEEAGIIEESDSPCASPIVVVKKRDKSLRICINYRKLNEVTQADAYPMP